MCPIKGLSESRRLPRLGKIHLGIKVDAKDAKGQPKLDKRGKQVQYPRATNYFVCPPEVQKVYGEKPSRLDVIIPVEDEEIWASQYYRQYSNARGLVCKGDGETCRRMIDKSNGDIAGRETSEVTWKEGLECLGRDCPDYQKKACQEVMNLQFLLPKVDGLGIWQIDTGSIHSIMNINNCAEMIRAMTGRVSWIPLVLSLEPTEVTNPDDGKKKTVHCMMLRYEGNAEQLLTTSEKPRLQVLLGRPDEHEAPDDRLLGTGTPEKLEELDAKVQDDISELWPDSDPIESTAEVIEQASEPVNSTKAKQKPPRDLTKLKSNTDMLHACHEDFGMQPADVLKELNVTRTTDLTETPAESYQRIAAVRK